MLRRETAALHAEVEDETDLPDSVRNLSQYVQLLGRYHDVHSSFEEMLGAERFAALWSRFGICLAAHRRTPQLTADLSGLPASTDGEPLVPTPLENFSQAVGCLYVLEGSSMGGPLLARSIASVLPGAPTAFLSGRGRNHPEPWRSFRRAVAAMPTADFAVDAVRGAYLTFATFGKHLSARSRSASFLG